jgi:hypothetical protein
MVDEPGQKVGCPSMFTSGFGYAVIVTNAVSEQPLPFVPITV